MRSAAQTVDQYLTELPTERQEAMVLLHNTILKHLPAGFEVAMTSGMINYVVPYSIYPAGYHCEPKQPLPFLAIASQKNFIAVYHMGIYADEKLLNWFVQEYPKYSRTKLDMGKSCIRFKKVDAIPYELIGELVAKMSPEDWVRVYEGMRGA